MKPCPLRGNWTQGHVSAAWLDRFDREELDRQLDQGTRPMRDLPDELHSVAGLEQVPGGPVQVLDPYRHHVDQRRARLLVEGESLGPLGECDQQRLQRVVRCAHRTEQLVTMSWPRALVLDVQAATRLDMQDVLLLVEAAEEGGDRNLQGLGQPRQGGQARRGLRVLDLRQHALGQAGELGELPDGQPAMQPELADAFRDDSAARLLQRPPRDHGSPLRPAVIARRQIDQLRHRSPSFPPVDVTAGNRPAGPVTRSERTNGLYCVMIQGLLFVNRELAPVPAKGILWPRVPVAKADAVTGPG